MLQKLKKLGLEIKGNIYHNLDVDGLIKKALERGEGVISQVGALTVTTGQYTGRSPEDRFIVDEPETHEKINWGKINLPLNEKNFDKLYQKITEYLSRQKEIFIFDGFAGAEKEYRLPLRVITEKASHSLFAKQLLRRPSPQELTTHQPFLTVLAAPGCQAQGEKDGVNSEAFIILNLRKKLIIIGGTSYAGEIKKSIFTFLNYLLPEKNVFPMHCSANIGQDNQTALFFGLSGTGKTTLSADPDRQLIGDDEHGWSQNGIFNFEGGCYAKCINLKKENEPQIYQAIKPGALVENVVMDPLTSEYDYADSSLTENSRAAYPIEHLPNAVLSGCGNHPQTIIFLTADAFGVMPPIAKLNHEQALYYYMSGYTSKLAGTERGIKEPRAVFSAAFGEPFMPQKPMVYLDLFKKYLTQYNTQVYLINTGWTGGPYGIGERFKIKDTRAMVKAALWGKLSQIKSKLDSIFNLTIPLSCPGVSSIMLDPVNGWPNKKEYFKKARELAKLFRENFTRFENIPREISQAGPLAF